MVTRDPVNMDKVPILESRLSCGFPLLHLHHIAVIMSEWNLPCGLSYLRSGFLHLCLSVKGQKCQTATGGIRNKNYDPGMKLIFCLLWKMPYFSCYRDTEDVSKGKHKLAGRESDGPVAKRSKSSVPEAHSLETERHFMQYFMMNVCAGYSSLLHVFQYLKVQELLRAARVCRMWRDMASHPSLVSIQKYTFFLNWHVLILYLSHRNRN